VSGADAAKVILYLHGGAHAIGSAASSVGLASDLARRAGARLVSVDYRLAPEHPHPAAVEDAVAVVRYVVSHAGGTIPFVASRFGIVDQMGVIPGGEERGPFADTLRRLHWDTASAFSDPVLTLLRLVTGLHNVVFGTDYPYPDDEITIAARHRLQTTDALSDTERDVIFSGAAARLIPRLAASAGTTGPTATTALGETS
jgi:predicted TIM-barrel fold metal-dependent hydrolase